MAPPIAVRAPSSVLLHYQDTVTPVSQPPLKFSQGLISMVSPKVKVKFKEDRSNKAEVTLIYLH